MQNKINKRKGNNNNKGTKHTTVCKQLMWNLNKTIQDLLKYKGGWVGKTKFNFDEVISSKPKTEWFLKLDESKRAYRKKERDSQCKDVLNKSAKK